MIQTKSQQTVADIRTARVLSWLFFPPLAAFIVAGMWFSNSPIGFIGPIVWPVWLYFFAVAILYIAALVKCIFSRDLTKRGKLLCFLVAIGVSGLLVYELAPIMLDL